MVLLQAIDQTACNNNLHMNRGELVDPNSTHIDLKGNDRAAVILPEGYNPNQIIIVRHEDNNMPIGSPVKHAPQTVLEHLQSDSLESSAKIKFIRKVYILVSFMIIITMGFCFLSYYVKEFYRFQIQNYWCLYFFLGVAFAITLVVIWCGGEVLQQCGSHFKLALLAVFTTCYAYAISFCTSVYAQTYGAPLVLEAMVLTSGMVGALTFYTFIVKQDFKVLIAILIVAFFCFILFGISFAFSMSGTLHSLWATFGVIIGGVILVIDTDWIANGERGCSLDDPVMGALIIYIDIMRIFLYLLMAMGNRKK